MGARADRLHRGRHRARLYTGIRSAISIAQGWQLARPIKLLGVSSADAVAAQAQTEGATGRVHVVIDAQRGEFYLAGYQLAAEGSREVEPFRFFKLRSASFWT